MAIQGGRAVAAEDVIVLSSSPSNDDGGEAAARVSETKNKIKKRKTNGLAKGKEHGMKKKQRQQQITVKTGGKEKVAASSSSSSSCSFSSLSINCSFPMSRVWRLVRGEATTTRTTPDAIFLINKASEMFLQLFAADAFANSKGEQMKSVSYKNLASTVCKAERYVFLSDFVPEKVRAEDGLKAAKGELVET